MAKPILHFKTKKDCHAAVRVEVNPYRDNGAVFKAPLVQELIATRHYGCKKHDLSPLHFRWGIHPTLGTRDCFYAFFQDSRFPDLGWKVLSFNKVVDGFDPERDLDKELVRQLRVLVAPLMKAYRENHKRCERCGEWSTEVDHVDPEFKVLAKKILDTLSVEKRAEILASYDFFREEPFTVPEDVATLLFKEHEAAVLMAVCHNCHTKNAKDRKTGIVK